MGGLDFDSIVSAGYVGIADDRVALWVKEGGLWNGHLQRRSPRFRRSQRVEEGSPFLHNNTQHSLHQCLHASVVIRIHVLFSILAHFQISLNSTKPLAKEKYSH